MKDLDGLFSLNNCTNAVSACQYPSISTLTVAKRRIGLGLEIFNQEKTFLKTLHAFAVRAAVIFAWRRSGWIFSEAKTYVTTVVTCWGNFRDRLYILVVKSYLSGALGKNQSNMNLKVKTDRPSVIRR